MRTKEEVLMSIELKKKCMLRGKDDGKLLDVRDINLKGNGNMGKRETNPLEPQYLLPGYQGKNAYLCGGVEKSKPQQPKVRIDSINLSL